MSVAVLFVLFLGLAFLGVPIGFAIGIGVLGSVFTSDIISLSYFCVPWPTVLIPLH